MTSTIPDLQPGETRTLMRAAARGDQAAWSRLYHANEHWMYTLVRGRIPIHLRARFDHEDVMQDAFLSLCKGAEVLETGDETQLKRFLAGMLRNGLRDEVRHHQRKRRNPVRETSDGEHALDGCESSEDQPSELAEKSDMRAFLIRALHRLPHDDQEIILRRYVDCLSWVEISNLLGLSEPTVRRRALEAIDRLMHTRT
ncbi:MAG: RNA polymerase sigma factor [Planctomycetes bacterium]|nr:RNA polymerase sigma factor [Planctomycetota bacterium]